MKQLFIHNPFFRIICPPVYGVIVYLLVLLVFDSVGQVTENFFSQEAMLCVVLSYGLSEALRLMVIGVNRYYPLPGHAKLHIFLQTALNMLCALVVVSSGVAVYFIYIVHYTTFRVELITLNVIYLLTSLFYTMLYLSIHYLQGHSQAKLEQETALRKKMEQQLVQLQREVNPELLYNSLETLICLVQQDATQAEEFIDRLSAVYRYSLDHRHKELSSVKDELKVLQQFLYLYNIKFSNSISVELTIEEEEESLLLAPGSLLDVMEEIILSTLFTVNYQLGVDIYVENNCLVLHYACNDKLMPRNSTPLVISHLSQTYSFFTDKKLSYLKTEEECLIKLPLLIALPEVVSPTHIFATTGYGTQTTYGSN